MGEFFVMFACCKLSINVEYFPKMILYTGKHVIGTSDQLKLTDKNFNLSLARETEGNGHTELALNCDIF